MEIKHLQLIRERLSYRSVNVHVLVPKGVMAGAYYRWFIDVQGVSRRVRRGKYGVPFHQAEIRRTLIKLQKNVTTPDTFHCCRVFFSAFGAGQPFSFQFCHLLAVRFVWE